MSHNMILLGNELQELKHKNNKLLQISEKITFSMTDFKVKKSGQQLVESKRGSQ